MTSEGEATSWQKKWELFHAALELDPERKRLYLEQACAGDSKLRGEVEALLAAHDAASPLDQEPLIDALVSERDPSEPAAGDRIGPYQILGVIGSGGMGVVYEAEQLEPVRRPVALKLIRSGLESAELEARFAAERQALALMSHPHIASVYDAGRTEHGRPYFVMELVRGMPITDYCQRHRLSLAERIALFLPVCHGVQHAHQKGVIHRDLKPSNILVALVDGSAIAKVIDFGVAMTIFRPAGDGEPRFELGLLVGTLEYMSPEQAEGGSLQIDTRSDVYALGMVLYELLAGRLPFDEALLHGDRRRLLEAVREQQPIPPSARLAGLGPTADQVAARLRLGRPALQRLLRGDLDSIVMKAIDKDPGRRYAAASELAADLERSLRDEPVHAAPPSRVYRLRKFVKRHRLGVAAGMMVALALAASVAGLVLAWIHTTRARDLAERERHKAIQISGFLQEMLAGIDPQVARGRDTALLEEILERASRRVDTELRGQPAVAASLHQTLAGTYRSLGQYDAAERHARAGWKLSRERLGADHLQTLAAAGMVALLLWDRGDLIESEALARATLESQRRVLGPEHEETLISANNLALVLKDLGRLDQVEPLYREVLSLRRKNLGRSHRSTLITQSNLARLLQAQGRLDEAEALMREAVAIHRRAYGMADPDTLISIDIFGTIQRDRGRLDQAEALHREALEGSGKVFGPNHIDTLAASYHLAITRMRQGDQFEAERLLRETLADMGAGPGSEHPFAILIQHQLGECLMLQERYTEARAVLKHARTLARRILPPDHPTIGVSDSKYGACLIHLKDFAGAERALLEARKLLEGALGAHHPSTREASEQLARLYRAWSRPARTAE